MPHVRFSENFDWKPLPQITIAHKAGWSGLVTTPCANSAVQANKALRMKTPKTGEKDGDGIFDPTAYHLGIRRGYNDFIAGKISRTEFGRRLAQEWASFPVLAPTKGASRALQRGETFYAGDKLNKALVTPERKEAILDKLKAAGSAPPSADQVMVVEKVPVVADPGELGENPAKSKAVITNFLTGIGMAVTAIGTFLGGLDWRVQLFICAMVGGFAVYAIKRRFDLYKAVKEFLPGCARTQSR